MVGYHYTSTFESYWHAGQARTFPYLRPFTDYGWLGVPLFFVISGFVICMSSWDRGLGKFFVSRVVRLYPAYCVAVAFTSFVVWVLPAGFVLLRLSQILANLTMVQTGLGVPNADGPYWTLWRELLFYLLFAMVIWRGVTYRRVVIFCVLWTAASVVTTATESSSLRMIVDPEYSMYFIAGVAFYLMRRFRPTVLLWGIVGFSWLLAQHQLSITVVAASAILGDRLDWGIAVFVMTLCFAMVAVVALGFTDWIGARWLTTAGALTYPLYLVHADAGAAVIFHMSPRLPKEVVLVGLVTVMMALAWLIHRFVERPLAGRLGQALGNGFAALRSGPSLPRTTPDR